MSVEFNHTISWCKDPAEAAAFTAEILGLGPPRRLFHFHVVDLANGASLDYAHSDTDHGIQHYAFKMSDAEFDAAYERIKAKNLDHWADPARKFPGRINTSYGGRGVYFSDPAGNLLEILTKSYVEAG